MKNELELNYVGRSFTVHIIVVAFFSLGSIVWQLISPWERTRLENLKLINASVRVDMVAMPKQTLNELKSATMPEQGVHAESSTKAESAKAEKIEAAVDKNTFLKEGKNKKSFAEMMKKIQRNTQEKVSDKVGVKSGTKNDSGVLKDLILVGNKVSQGTAITGKGGDNESGPFIDYLSQLPEQVRVYWKLPTYLMNKNFKARVRIYIGSSGQLLRAEIFESSGSPEYDQRAIEAIKLSVPFPVPEQGIQSRLSRGDVVLGFPL
jgi:TonB family protein